MQSISSKETASPLFHGSSASSMSYHTNYDRLATYKPQAERVQGKRKVVHSARISERKVISSSKNIPHQQESSTECNTPHQCCCREKGVVDVCWGYCVDIKEYSSKSRSMGVVMGICAKWMSLINYCVYCFKPGMINFKIAQYFVDEFIYKFRLTIF